MFMFTVALLLDDCLYYYIPVAFIENYEYQYADTNFTFKLHGVMYIYK